MASFAQYGDGGFSFARLLTGNPWQVQVAEKVFKDTGDEAVKNFFGTQGWDTWLMEKLKRLSDDPLMRDASRLVYMKAHSGLKENVILSFLKHIDEPDNTPDPGKKLDKFMTVAILGIAAYIIFQMKPVVSALFPKRKTAP
jgi:hypothetical protein